MFKNVRHLSEAIHALASSLIHIGKVLPKILEAWETVGPLEDRLAELERSRASWEAEIEANSMRAVSKFKQARASEERTRTMADNAKALADGDEGEEAVEDDIVELLRRNGFPSGNDEVQAVPTPVVVDPKARAIAAKFRGLA